MGWKDIPGLNGKLYVPDPPPGTPKKHRCIDCFSCQFCSDERCSICLEKEGGCRCRDAEKDSEDGVNGQTV